MFVIVGKTGSGKTTLKEALLTQNPFLKRLVSYTTRQPRLGEENGVDYHFITRKQFEEHSDFILTRQIGETVYGIKKEDIHNNYILTILNLEGINELSTYISTKSIHIIYFDIPKKILIQRLLKRGDRLIDIHQRLKQDEKISLDLMQQNFHLFSQIILTDTDKKTTYQNALDFIRSHLPRNNIISNIQQRNERE